MVPSDVLSPAPGTQPDAQSTRPQLEEPKLLQALAEVRADSQRLSEQYLRDTVVPHGGE